MDETRQRFVDTFVAQCDSLGILVDEIAAFGASPAAALTEITHRLNGLAGTIGFPTVSARAAELEGLLDGARAGLFDAALAHGTVGRIREAFAHDLERSAAQGLPRVSAAPGAKILVAENEPAQLAILTTRLEGAGYVPVAVAAGDQVVARARAEQPALILLENEMPLIDGFSVCQRLKTDPGLADIPVILMTTSHSLDDKLTGLALGADEVLTKPVDMRELVLRVQLLLKRSRGGRSRGASASGLREGAGIVVVADDDPDITRIIEAQIRAAGHQAILAVDGEEALAAVRTYAPDVLVLDLMMPKINGFEVLSKIGEGPAPRPKTIVLSARGREFDVVRAFALGADDYMTKPFRPQELVARMARLLKSAC